VVPLSFSLQPSLPVSLSTGPAVLLVGTSCRCYCEICTITCAARSRFVTSELFFEKIGSYVLNLLNFLLDFLELFLLLCVSASFAWLSCWQMS
jgi:hypothetical protein